MKSVIKIGKVLLLLVAVVVISVIVGLFLLLVYEVIFSPRSNAF
jgi:hypothetical protein